MTDEQRLIQERINKWNKVREEKYSNGRKRGSIVTDIIGDESDERTVSDIIDEIESGYGNPRYKMPKETMELIRQVAKMEKRTVGNLVDYAMGKYCKKYLQENKEEQ